MEPTVSTLPSLPQPEPQRPTVILFDEPGSTMDNAIVVSSEDSDVVSISSTESNHDLPIAARTRLQRSRRLTDSNV